jgi:signal transduction histidine kinase
MSVAVTWVYAAGVLAVALLMLADARLRALPRAPVDLLIELGIAGDVGATPRERALARELQASHATLVDRLDEQLAELRDSRRRLAEASLTAAAELADDLHDRVRRPLAELLALRSPTGPAAARFDEARHHIQIVDAEISAILIGLGPRSLDDGLRDSLRALAEMCPIPTSLRVDDGPIPSRIVLHSAYLACAEALANVAKHSSASSATIDVRRRDDLELTITDDGSGGADPRRGTGLTGMRDRVEAIGGSLALSSTTSGTQIRIRLPLDVPEPHRAERSSVLLAQEEPR